MKALLTPLIGTRIHIEQHNDVGVTGWLVSVQSDYVSVYTADGKIIHYPLSHIKSFTTQITELPQEVPVPDVDFPSSFRELLTSLWMHPVQIELGDGTRRGVLVQVSDETICLVLSSRELIYYPIVQVVNLSPVFALKESQESPRDPEDNGQEGTNATPSAKQTEASTDTTSKATGETKADTRTDSSSSVTAVPKSDVARLTLFRERSRRSRRGQSVLKGKGGQAGQTRGTRAAFNLMHSTAAMRVPQAAPSGHWPRHG